MYVGNSGEFSWVRIGLILSTLFLTVAVILASAGPSQAPQKNQYIDSRACAACHSGIYESYRRTSMGQSLFAPTPANTVEDYKDKRTFYHAPSDTHYSMIVRDGVYYQRRWQTGFDGGDTNIEEMKIDYVIGAGDHARSYLHRTDLGTLIELPLGWYSERGGYWAMSPGFDSHHPQTRRLVSYECMFCHNGYPQNPTANQARSPEPVFFGELPQGIDCQRCHGPGSLHVRTAQTAGAKPADIRASIVNPARLNPKLQMEACMQCHLEPTSGRIPSLIRRFNRAPYSYVPGQPLEDFILYFDYPAGKGHDDKFEIASAAYRLRKSRCFVESKGALTCLTCHDPHQSLPTGEAGATYFSSKCLGCHQPALGALVAVGKHTNDSNCLSCHMPKRRTEDVVHAVITDHFIQRQIPTRDLLAELPERHLTDAEDYHGEVAPYYPSPLPQTGENPLYQAVAQVALQNNLQQGLDNLSREISRQPPREMEFYTALGDAYRNSGDAKQAAAAFQQAVLRSPDSVTALQSLAGAYKASGEAERSEETLKRALHIAPSDANVWFQYGMLEAGLGRTGSAIEKVQKAVALNPDLPEAYTSLAGLLVATGQLDPAEAAVRSALKVDPYDAAAYNAAGRVLASKGQTPEALYDFAKAARLRPGYGPYHYDYALMLVRLNRLDEAQQPAEAAVQGDPDFAAGHELLGSLLARKSQLAEAASEYQRAVQIQPDFSRAQLDLGLVLAAQGDLAGATEHLRKAAQGRDAEVAQRAAQALERIEKH
jgi:tetratricopeptide (TPR) repeat protein